jgi:hypothetical protein
MASNEIEVLEPAPTVEKLKEIKSGRAIDRRRFMTAVGVAGAASGAALMSTRRSTPRPGVVLAAGPSDNDVFNYMLNIVYLEATFYSYVTQGVDLPGALTIGSGAITNPPAKLVFTGPSAAQITDLFNELYYDELSHVKDLLAIQGTAAAPRAAINLAAYQTITASNAIGIARLIEDVGVTAYAGVMGLFSAPANLTYAAQILGVESMHAGALRLTTIQNPAIAPYFPAGSGLVGSTGVPVSTTFTAWATAGSPTLTNVYFNTTTLAVGQVVTGPGIPGTAKIVSIASPGTNTSITGTLTKSSTSVTGVSSIAGLVVGQLITGTNITAGTTITAIGATAPFTLTLSIAASAAATGQALVVGAGAITLSANVTGTSATNVTYNIGNSDAFDVPPIDPVAAGSTTLSALATSGPTAAGAFFATTGAASATTLNPAGMAFARTTSQALAVLYGAAGVEAVAGINKGGFFVNGVTGAITTV